MGRGSRWVELEELRVGSLVTFGSFAWDEARPARSMSAPMRLPSPAASPSMGKGAMDLESVLSPEALGERAGDRKPESTAITERTVPIGGPRLIVGGAPGANVTLCLAPQMGACTPW